MSVPPRHIGPALLLGLFASSAAGLSPPVPMLLLSVDTIGSDSTGFALAPGPILGPVTGLRLAFEFPVSLQARDLQLIEAGPDGRIETLYCMQQPAGDDQRVALTALRHGVPASEIAADFGPASGLAAGAYRFLLCEQLGAPTQRHDFTIAETGRLDNPNFSTSLDGWWFAPLTRPEPQVSHSSIDADGSTVSGALRVSGAAGGSLLFQTESCARDLRGGHRLRLKHRVLQGEVRVRMTLLVGFSGDQGDAPCVGPALFQYDLVSESGPSAGFDTLDSGRLPPLPLLSATLVIEVQGIGDTAFDVLLDDIGFSHDPSIVFRSNFD